ncbi:hypothetical protein ABG79_02161 [Caloramator mitchellensis]|uniref:Uncharacterized protein n=1 Tax=Caloramator mitchellensis TaxID=908809 RepID=A0A0R3JUV4_CALMK|nr:hypothetical protein [Caloramator mitchellensis]KRQ86029.1 hypothetical protein ABG79_02161 [Caloramator mitchellensis]
MIDKQYGKHILVCNMCGEEYEFDSYDEAIKYMRENGWRSKNYGGEWEDICDICWEEIENE